jgi:CheY-like chemotaxis protein
VTNPKTTAGRSPRVLLVDDVDWARDLLARDLWLHCGIDTLEAANALAALTILEQLHGAIDGVVADLRMPGLQGDALLHAVGERWPHIKRVMLTAYSTGEMILDSPYLVLDKALSARTVAEQICALVKP